MRRPPQLVGLCRLETGEYELVVTRVVAARPLLAVLPLMRKVLVLGVAKRLVLMVASLTL